jgi:hypothetical protein
LTSTLILTKNQLTSDPHDKIYGILALSQKNEREKIQVNYEAPVAQIYQEAMMVQFVSGSAFHYLTSFAYHSPSHVPRESPSWVPDFTREPEIDEAALEGEEPPRLHEPEEVSVENNILMLPCIRLDIVQAVEGVGAEPAKTWRSILTNLQVVSGACEGDYLDQNILKLRDPKCVDDPFWKSFFLALQIDTPHSTTAGQLGSLWSSWTHPNYPEGWPPSLYAPNDCDSYKEWLESVCKDSLDEFELSLVDLNVSSRAIFKTGTGFFGIAPAATSPGDILVIFSYSDGIMALRPTGTYYTMVGAVYVCGISDEVKLEEIQELYVKGTFQKQFLRIG